MGWHINLVSNTVEIDSQTSADLWNCGADICSTWQEETSEEEFVYSVSDGKLYFDPDHQEHMDYIDQPEILEVLLKHKVKGDICFSSEEGDNRGQKWGYRFTGDGKMIPLKGKAIYSEPAKPKAKKAKQDKPAKTSRWIMCATSESSDHYCCCGVWDHKPSQQEIDVVRVSLDSGDYDGEDDWNDVVVVDGKKYVCYVSDYQISEIEV